MTGPVFTPPDVNEGRDFASQLRVSPANIVTQVMELARVIGKYGLATVIFAFPVVLGCYGLYFLWLAVSTPQVNMAKAMVGMFTTLFSPGVTILLLWVFTRLNLWKELLKGEAPKLHRRAKAA